MVFIALVDCRRSRDCSSNPYAGLVVFVAIPAVFVLGLLLIPVGHVAASGENCSAIPTPVADWPVFDFRQPTVRDGLRSSSRR